MYISIFKLYSILEVDFLNLCIYVQTQKNTGGRFLPCKGEKGEKLIVVKQACQKSFTWKWSLMACSE